MKNPRRAAGQARRMVKVQRDRAIGHVVVLTLLLAVGVTGCFVNFIPMVVQVVCFVLCPVALFGIYADLRLRNDYVRKAESLSRQSEGK